MNDEIKEILDNLKDEVWSKTGADSYDKLLDYITNLQQERDKYKMRCYNSLKMIWDNYGVLDKYEIEMLEDILEGKSDE